MIYIIHGASHTGKTMLAQRLLEDLHIPYLSQDHLKMGLIRSRQTTLTPMDKDDILTAYLWPITREMIKTAIENSQSMIVEGCYIPADFASDFSIEERAHIRSLCLIMSEDYIRANSGDIRRFASVIEDRIDDSYLTLEGLLADNKHILNDCIKQGCRYHIFDSVYDADVALQTLKSEVSVQ